MAKKKKSAANPARGFTTTSVASKHNAEPQEKPASEKDGAVQSKNEDHLAVKTLERERANPDEKLSEELSIPLTELTPEAVEARLDAAYTQSIVDKYSEKSSRDASRHVDRLLGERRILRKHAQTVRLYTPKLLGHQVVSSILEQAKLECIDSDNRISGGDSSRTKVSGQPNEDDMIAKLWTLRRSLILLKFQQQSINGALNYAAQNYSRLDQAGNAIWGLEDCLEWLILHTDESELPSYDEVPPNPQAQEASDSDSNSDMALATPQSAKNNRSSQKSLEIHQDNHASDVVIAAKGNPLDEDLNVDSDLQSDLEPEQLLSTYLDLKSRLYQLQPELTEKQAEKQKRTKVKASEKIVPESTAASKLLSKMRQIESDPLFDIEQTRKKWILKRNELNKELSRKRKTSPQRPKSQSPGTTEDETKHSLDGCKAEAEVEDLQSSLIDSEDDNGLSALFQSNPNHEDSSDGLSYDITVKDFGAPSGLSPKRVLEETLRSRDPKVKLEFKMISQTAFLNRCSLSIAWSKQMDIGFPLELKDVSSYSTGKFSSFSMRSVATPDYRQSEAYVSVIALFQIFSQSTTEAKVHLRLPSVWRDLWSELQSQHKLEVESTDRDTVRALRSLIQPVPDTNQAFSTGKTKEAATEVKSRQSVESRTSNRYDPSVDRTSEVASIKNIWTSVSQTPSYERMLEFRKTLPIFKFRNVAMSAIEEHQVTIICGETGCGKSTQMPSFVLEQELSNSRACKIYCTEPRRISAITLARRVNEELGAPKDSVGSSKSLVGYAIRLESKISSTTRLVYVTTGILLRMLETDHDLEEVSHIFIDEVHERSIETDFLLIVLRTLLKRRPKLKIILMSATLNSERFASYFDNAPILNVPGRTYPVQSKFLEDAIELTGYAPEAIDDPDFEDSQSDGINSIEPKHNSSEAFEGYTSRTKRTLAKFDEYRIDYQLIVKLLAKIFLDAAYENYTKAILIFLPGIGEIRRLADMLGTSDIPGKFVVHALHSAIPSEEQQKAFDPPPSENCRKIVISTNIAETGVTIPGVTCVIDTGKHREMRFDEKRQISRLVESFISKANAKQRRGRAGRVQAGMCFHLFTRARHDHVLSDEQAPEMLRLSLQELVMRVKICKLGDVQTTLALALDPPSTKNIQRAIDTLTDIGALTHDEELTPLGRHLSKIPLDPYLGKLLLNGLVFKCLDSALTIAAILTGKSVFVIPVNGKQKALAARKEFAAGNSDLLTDRNAYNSWRRVCSNKSESEFIFCRKNLLSLQALTTIEDLKAQLLLALSETGLASLENSERLEISRISNTGRHGRKFVPVLAKFNDNEQSFVLETMVIAISFYPKILVRNGKGWRNVVSNQAISIHPASILCSPSASLATATHFLSFYSILRTSTGLKNYNATSLSPVPSVSLVLFVGEASWNTVAQAVSLDGSRIRFSVEADSAGRAWKEFIALKILRRRLREVLVKSSYSKANICKMSQDAAAPWLHIWGQVVQRIEAASDVRSF